MPANNISPSKALELLSSGEAVLIDVREPDEFKLEHIAYASSLPLGEVNTLLEQHLIPVSRKIIFQCLSGRRAGNACVVASEGVFADYEIYNIEGGISAWKEEGLPVVGSVPSNKFSIFRQVQMVVGSLVFLLVMAGMLSGLGIMLVFAAIIGAALAFAGYSGNCVLADILNKMPWNK